MSAWARAWYQAIRQAAETNGPVPEFVSAPVRYGKPPIFITHGVQDPVLSVNFSESMVRQLERSGYHVEFKEFSGGHFMREDLVKESFRWFAGTGR